MKIIRTNVFETNSSSTHTLVIPHEVSSDSYNVYDSLDHEYQFGRGEYHLVDHYDEKIAYTYYVLTNFKERYDVRDEDAGYGSKYEVSDEDLVKFKEKVNEAYKEVIKETKYKPYDSEPTPDDIFYLIDHENELAKYRHSNDADVPPQDVDPEVLRIASILPAYTASSWCNYVYVDHTEDFGDNGFINKMLNADVAYLKRWLFSKESYIAVCGDEYSGYFIKTIGFEYDYDDIPTYQIDEQGNRCPERDKFPDTEEGWNAYWEESRKYPITMDDGGFFSKLEEYKKNNDVFMKGN